LNHNAALAEFVEFARVAFARRPAAVVGIEELGGALDASGDLFDKVDFAFPSFAKKVKNLVFAVDDCSVRKVEGSGHKRDKREGIFKSCGQRIKYALEHGCSMQLTWLGHSSLKLTVGEFFIYIDPYAGPEEWYQTANLILVSEWHFDHCNMTKVNLATGEQTHRLGTPQVAANMFPCGTLRPEEVRNFGKVEVVGMPVKKHGITHRGHEHEEQQKLGFVIMAENKRVQFLSDSEFLEEFMHVKPDVLLIPVGGTYTLDAKEAAEIARLIEPKLAIPIFWGAVCGTRDDAELFAELAEVPVQIIEPGQPIQI